MFARSVRASCSPLARVPGLQARRAFITPTFIRHADIVQDLYLRELKAYKPAPVKASDADGHVQKFSAPKAPSLPEEGDMANDLKAYEDQQVEIEGQATSGEGAAEDKDWFEDDLEEEPSGAH
ncbi:MAG: hypothetical protein M1836_007196 [Candelina mexicana]|nr:MAG: hypothetical protein M1836_007196 [Candelina mexicana]